MRIDRLTLKNFRGFESLDLCLHPRCTVLAGVNASGKTSVLDALAVGMGTWFLGFDLVRPSAIKPDDVRLASQWAWKRYLSEPQYPVEVTCEGEVSGQGMRWTRALLKEDGKTTYGQASELQKLAGAAQAQVKAGASVTLPLLAYYGAGRLWMQKKATQRKLTALEEASPSLRSRTSGYEDCLELASSHKLMERWLARESYAEMEAFKAAHERGIEHMPSGALEAVSETVSALVEGAIRLSYSPSRGELSLLYQSGESRPFRLLSDGYRSLIALAADLTWRALQLNPHLGSQAAQASPGVVLIDELELHLHPAWQRTVLEHLTGAFPALQFVVTTHSPRSWPPPPLTRFASLTLKARFTLLGSLRAWTPTRSFAI